MRFIIFLFLFTSFIGNAQQADSLRMEKWYAQALFHFDNNRLDSFEYYYSKVAKALKKQDDLVGWISKHKALAKKILLEREQPEKSMVYLERSLEANLFRRPVSDKEWEELGYLYIFTGYVRYNEFEQFDLALEAYGRAKEILIGKLRINDFYVARYLILPLSNIYTMKGDYSAAETLLKKCYQICLESKEYDYAASVLSDLSIVYIDLGAYDKALATCKKGLLMDISDEVALGLLNSNLAKSLYFKGQLEESLPFAFAANGYFRILIDDGWGESATGWMGINKSLMGEIYTALGEFDSAFRYFSEAELLFDNIHDTKFDRDFGKLYQAWGRAELAAGNPAGALVLFQRSLRSMLPIFKAENPSQNPDINDLYAENTLMDALLGKAMAFDKLFDADANPRHLEAALDCHDLVFEVEKRLRQSYYYEDSKLFNVEESRERCGHAISVCMKLSKVKDRKKYQGIAFEFAERSKSILLLEAFLKNSPLEKSGLPPQLLQEEKRLLNDIANHEKDLFRREKKPWQDSIKIQQERENLFDLKKQYADWKAGVQKRFSQYYDNRYNDTAITVSEVQEKVLNSNETLLEYFTGKSMIYLFVITQKKFEVFEIKKTDGFESDVIALHESIRGYAQAENLDELCKTYTRLAQHFYDLLIRGPEEKGLLSKNILVIPSGILSYIQFEALLTGTPKQSCLFNQYPYALYGHTFHYGYSATLHYRLGELPSHAHGDFMGFAPQFNGHNGWGALKANVNLLKGLEKGWKGLYALNDSATILRLQESLANRSFEVIHFSTHAQANMDNGDFSFIVFSDGHGGYDSLFVKDIYQLEFLSEMVVLGACETATGTLSDGEGVISLARAFLQTGSRSVITTMWNVFDETNRNVMSDFYANLKKGMNKSEALQQAKISRTHHDSQSAHPVFWAAYIPYGQMQAIRTNRMVRYYLAGGGILFMAFIFFLVKRKAGKRNKVPISVPA